MGLAKPYLFSIPLTFVLAAYFGETGIWLAAPLAEAALLLLTLLVLINLRRRHGPRRYAAPTLASEGNS